MKKTRTISESYEALKAVMPQRIREEFDQIEAGERLPELYYDLPFKKAFHPDPLLCFNILWKKGIRNRG